MLRAGSFVTLLALGCMSGLNTKPGEVVVGEFGGVHVGLALTETGGTIEYDCARGGLFSAVRPDASGRFDVSGTHVREHGGPTRVGEVPDSQPARYVGRFRGDRLTLQVFVGADTLGTFELRRGEPARIFRCL
jgi:hypothetical protein